MKKLGTVALLLTSLSAQAQVIHLQITTHLQDGVPLPELGQCFLNAAEPRDVEGDDVFMDLKADVGNQRAGTWKKSVIIGQRRVEYRLTATQAPHASLKLRAQIFVDGTLEHASTLDLEGKDPWGVPVNFAEATLMESEASCRTANLTVVTMEKVPSEELVASGR